MVIQKLQCNCRCISAKENKQLPIFSDFSTQARLLSQSDPQVVAGNWIPKNNQFQQQFHHKGHNNLITPTESASNRQNPLSVASRICVQHISAAGTFVHSLDIPKTRQTYR